MNAADITAPQRENMLHALGCSEQNVPNRNFFWTDADSEDGLTWVPLVDAGLAWRSGPKAMFGGMCMYAVTDAGIAALGITDLSGLERKERFTAAPSPQEAPPESRSQTESKLGG